MLNWNPGTAAALTLALLCGPALAGPAPGCFERDYSAAHLAKNPAQVVDRIVMHIVANGAETAARLWVTTARQGHALADGMGGLKLAQTLICWTEAGADYCGVECDGGTLRVTKRDASGLTFETKYLMIGDIEDCGGALDLAEVPGQTVAYRLNAAPDALCAAEY